MSTFVKLTKHPDTGEWENAQWLDDYYGRHNYGVRFPDGKTFDVRDWVLETKESKTLEFEVIKTSKFKHYQRLFWHGVFTPFRLLDRYVDWLSDENQ